MRTIIAFSAVGSLQEEIKPRDFVIPDQVIDRTKGIRPFTFWEGGAVSHVGFGDPFDENVAKIVRACGHSLEGDGVRLHDRGLLVCMGMFSSPSSFHQLDSFLDYVFSFLSFPFLSFPFLDFVFYKERGANAICLMWNRRTTVLDTR